MRPTVAHVAWFVCVYVCWSPTEMPFRVWTRGGPSDHAVGWRPDPPMGKGFFLGGGVILALGRQSRPILDKGSSDATSGCQSSSNLLLVALKRRRCNDSILTRGRLCCARACRDYRLHCSCQRALLVIGTTDRWLRLSDEV